MLLSREQKRDIRKAKKQLMFAQTSSSEDWETQEGWEKVVCKAVMDHGLAPREAQAILKAAGYLTEHRIDPCEFFIRSITTYFGKIE